MERIRTLGPYRVEFQFTNGNIFSFVMDDPGHARVMDEFFTQMSTGARPALRRVSVSDAMNNRWYNAAFNH
jgi:hypothetical protein